MTTDIRSAGWAGDHAAASPGVATIGRRYLLGDCLGRGSFGEVYHAFDTVERRELALKVLCANSSTTPAPFQLRQEFCAARALRHPHLVEVFDFGFDGDRPYFTMELITGPRLLVDAPRPMEWVCDVLAQMLLALEFMHARGAVHRDLKPDNVRFDGEGQLKLLDFGLLETTLHPASRHDGGTLGYVAPEVLAGRRAGTTADLYAVGAIAYELLAGRRLFVEQEPSELINAILHAAPEPLAALRPDLPEALVATIESLLAKQPGERPDRASNVLRALAPWLNEERRQDLSRQAFSYLLSPGLVGREREQEVLQSAVHAASAGQGCAVMVGARAGVGKSRLVREFRLQCQLDNVPFITATCSCEGMAPYGALGQILNALEPFLTDRHRSRYGDRLGPLFPGSTTHPGPGLDKVDVTVAVANLIAEVAQTASLVIWIDDLQWADTPSLEALTYSVYEHRNAPVLWLGTYRSDEVGPTHPICQLLAEPNVTGLELAPFAPCETAALVQSMLGTSRLPEGALRLLESTTGGNGFFIVEMLRYLVERGLLHHVDGSWHFTLPNASVKILGSLESLICRRLESLSTGAQVVARFAAVLAEDPTPDVLLHLSGEPEAALLESVSELIVHNFWQSAEGRYSFVHDRIREAIYDNLPDAERRALHHTIAMRLAVRQAPAATLAYHCVRGGALAKGVQYLRRAGLEAESMGAMQEAFRHWKQATDLLAEHPALADDQLELDLWLDLGIKCGFSVNSKVGEEMLERAISRLEAAGNPFLVAGVMRGFMRGLNALPRGPRLAIKAWLERPAVFRLPVGWRRRLPPNYLALIPLLLGAYTYLVICYNTNGKIARALDANARARRLVPDPTSWAWGVVMVPYAYSRVLEGRFDESIRIAREAFALLKDAQIVEAIDLSCAALVLANNQVYQGQPIALELGAELERRAAAHHMTEWQGMVQYAPMVAHALSGRTRETQEAIDLAQPFSRRCGRGTVLEREICLATARLHAARGEFEPGMEVIEAALRLDAVVALPYFTSRLFEIRGRMHLERGDLDAAAADFQEVIVRESSYGLRFTLPEAHVGLSEVARRRRDLDEAERQLALAQAILCEPGFDCELKQLYLHAQRGRIARSRGDEMLAASSLEAAMQLALKLDNPWQRALVQVEQGRLAVALRNEDAARQAWTAALAGFTALDNPWMCRQVRRLLEHGFGSAARPSNDPDQLATLRAFSEDVLHANSVEAVLEAILVHAVDVLDGQRGAILRQTSTGFDVVVGREHGVNTWGSGPEIGHSAVREALASGEPLLLADTTGSLSAAVREGASGRRALVCLPLETGTNTLVVYADRRTSLPEGFDETRLSILHSLVQFGRLALGNASLIVEAQGRSERLQMLNQTSLLVSSSLQLRDVLDHVLDRVLELTGAELALVVETDGEPYQVLGSRGSEAHGDDPPAYSRSAVDKVVKTRTPLCVFDTDASPHLPMSQSVLSLGVRSIMGVPLEVHDRLLGVLYASSRISTRTFTEADVEFLRAIAVHAALAIHNARQFELVQQKRALESELTIAHSIQQSFFPRQVPALRGLGVAGTCRAAREVGGDYYDVIPLTGGRIAVTVGDVSGKSVSAALYMAMVRTALRMSLERGLPPTRCLAEVNARMNADIHDGSFITCFLGIYDPGDKTFEYAAAGHRLGYWLGGSKLEPLAASGLPLGMEPEAFEAGLAGHVLRPAPGDRLVIFTDGLIEAQAPDGTEFGEEGLARVLGDSESELPADTLARVIAAIERHEGGSAPWDDLTLLIARVEPDPRVSAPAEWLNTSFEKTIHQQGEATR